MWTKVAAGLKTHRISLEAFHEGHMRKDASVARETSQWVELTHCASLATKLGSQNV